MTMLAIYPPKEVLEHAEQYANADVLNNGLHVTLVRLGQTNDTEAKLLKRVLEQSAALLEPIRLSVEGTGFFNARDFYVHWLLINGAGLDIWRGLFLNIIDKMDLLAPQRYGYTPHMTLGYHSKEDGLPKGWEKAGEPPTQKRWYCNEIYLVRGPEHKEVISIGPPPKYDW